MVRVPVWLNISQFSEFLMHLIIAYCGNHVKIKGCLMYQYLPLLYKNDNSIIRIAWNTPINTPEVGAPGVCCIRIWQIYSFLYFLKYRCWNLNKLFYLTSSVQWWHYKAVRYHDICSDLRVACNDLFVNHYTSIVLLDYNWVSSPHSIHVDLWHMAKYVDHDTNRCRIRHCHHNVLQCSIFHWYSPESQTRNRYHYCVPQQILKENMHAQ